MTRNHADTRAGETDRNGGREVPTGASAVGGEKKTDDGAKEAGGRAKADEPFQQQRYTPRRKRERKE